MMGPLRCAVIVDCVARGHREFVIVLRHVYARMIAASLKNRLCSYRVLLPYLVGREFACAVEIERPYPVLLLRVANQRVI